MTFETKGKCIASLIGYLIVAGVGLWGFVSIPQIDSGFDWFMIIFAIVLLCIGVVGMGTAIMELRAFRGSRR